MTDDVFATTTGGGLYWKPADHAGQVHIFMYPTDGGPNAFGNDCAKCEAILVLKDGKVTDTFTGNVAEVSQQALRSSLLNADTPVVAGTVAMGKSEKTGRDLWTLTLVEGKTREDTMAAFKAVCELVDGHWVLVTDPKEAPF